VPFFHQHPKEKDSKSIFFAESKSCSLFVGFEINNFVRSKSLIFMELEVKNPFNKQIFFCYIKDYFYFG
jgi:hypothetical protein